jgi:DUF4097 and DUF4098 domain-containing protein YvlB
MHTFETPEPISVTVEIGVGDVRFTASDRADTVVEVRPSDETDESDVRAATQIRVDYTGGVLRVTGPRRTLDFSRKTKSVDVSIELPHGSQVAVDTQAGDLRGAGRLGQCRLKTAVGNVSLGLTGPLRLSTAAGHVTAEGITGDADITTGSGRIQIGAIEGAAVVKNSNGETKIDTVTGDLRVRSANGDITVEKARSGVDAKTSNGSIRLGEVTRGSVVLGSAMGDLDVGIADGTAAWLEVGTGFGHVRNSLDDGERPAEAGQTVEVRGRTTYGDVTIHRS